MMTASKGRALSVSRMSWLCLFLLVFVGGCDPDEPESKTAQIIINVTTVDADNKPVPTVRFYINGQKYGMTYEDGRAPNVEYMAKVGETITFDVEEPDGYRVPVAVNRAEWKHVVNSTDKQVVNLSLIHI